MLRIKTTKQIIVVFLSGAVLIILGGMMFMNIGGWMSGSQANLSTSILTIAIPAIINNPVDENDPKGDLLLEASNDCKTWFDGCNTCNRVEGGEWSCTKIACEGGGTAEPSCTAHFDKTEINLELNNDREITLVDALSVMKYVAGVSSDEWFGPTETGDSDVDCDGDVDLIDALLFAKKVAGLDMSNTKWCTNNSRGSFLETVRAIQ